MVAVADVTLYRDEWIQGFERIGTSFRNTVTTDAMVEGKTAVFLVANSNREAVTRGPNGLIPAAADDFTLPTVTLAEYHDKPRKTRFNIFTGQSDQRAIMQAQSRNVINRRVDDTIVDALDTATVTIGGAAAIMNKGLATRAMVTLGTSEVPIDDQLFGVLTPNQWGHLTDDETFTSADYVDVKPLKAGMPDPQAKGIPMLRWNNINWFPSTALPGMGTDTATCFVYHRSAVGYCHSPDEINVSAGYNDEDDYYWARHTVFHGALNIQNAGIVKIIVDDTQYVAP